MDALWMATALVVSVLGGWPVTAGLLKFAKSKTVRAVDAAEAGTPEVAAPEAAGDAAAAEVAGPAGEVSEHPEGAGSLAGPAIPEAGQALEGGPSAVEHSGTSDTPATDAQPGTPATPPSPRTEVLRGGLLIGFLERAAVTVAILAGQPVAIAYVVAIKGLGRYPELKDTPAASERFIIGTLASMLWAASVAALAKALLL